MSRTLAIVIALAGLFPLRADENRPRDFTGKVVRLGEALRKQDVALDADAAPFWLALVSDDGRTYPLVKDAGSRMFFKDKSLIGRAVRLEGRLVGNSVLLQVLAVRTLVDRRWHEPYYWCEVCQIKRFEPNNCECCGAPMEFREVPVDK